MRKTRRKLWWTLGILGGLVLVYLIIVLLVIPWLAPPRVAAMASDQLGAEVQIEEVFVNPLLLTGRASGIVVTVPGKGEVAEVESIFVDPKITSVFSDAFEVERLAVESPGLFLKRSEDGQWNFAPIIEHLGREAQREDEEAAAFVLQEVSVEDGRVIFEDHSFGETPLQRDFQNWNITLSNLHTGGETGGGTTEAVTGLGEAFDLQADFSLDPLEMRGQFDVRDIRISGFNPVITTLANLQVDNAILQSSGQFVVDLEGEPEVSLSELVVRLADLEVREEGSGPLVVEGELLTVGSTSVSLLAGDIALGPVAVQGFHLLAVRNEQGELSLLRQLGIEGVGEPGPSEDEGAAAWSVSLAGLEVVDTRVQLRDLAVGPSVDEEIVVERLRVGKVTYPQPEPVEVAFQGQALQGTMQADGTLAPGELSGSGSVSFSDVQPNVLIGYLREWVNAEQLNARFSGEFDLEMQGPASLQAMGDLRVEDLALFNDPNDPLLAWDMLSASALNATTQPLALEAGSVALESPILVGILTEGGGFRPAFVEAIAKAAAGEGEEAPEEAPAVGEVRIGAFRVSDGTVRFMDRSMREPVEITLGELQVEGQELAYGVATTGNLQLTATVNGIAPLEVEADLSLPTQEISSFDVSGTAALRSLRVSMLSPYAERVMGYQLAVGTLDADVEYALQNAVLEVENSLLIENLELGPPSDLEGAPSLPMPLAVALLKDGNGNIRVDIPISGQVTNPTFELGGVFSQVLGNTLTSLASSPFRIIGSIASGIAGDGDEKNFSQVPFLAGTAEMAEGSERQLSALADALQQRPALALVIPPATNREADAPALREQALMQEVDRLHPAERSPEDVPFPELPLEQKQAAISHFLASRGVIDVPQMQAAGAAESSEQAEEQPQARAERLLSRLFVVEGEGQPRETAQDMTPEEVYEALYQRALEEVEVGDAELEELARERSRTVAQAQVNAGIAEDRLRIPNSVEEAVVEEGSVLLSLSLSEIEERVLADVKQ